MKSRTKLKLHECWEDGPRLSMPNAVPFCHRCHHSHLPTHQSSLLAHMLSIALFATCVVIAAADSNSTPNWTFPPKTSHEVKWSTTPYLPLDAASTSTPPLIESFSGTSSPHAASPKSFHVNTLDHSNANHRDEAEQDEANRNSHHDPISRSLPSAKRPKLLPNSPKRQSKLDEEFPTVSPILEAPAEQRDKQPPVSLNKAKPKGPGNPPSSMDDIIGGLLTLMGGNMKLPPGAQQPPANGNSASDKLANLLANLGAGPKSRPPHGAAQMGPHQRPPIPPFGSLPNLNLAKLQNRPHGVAPGQGGNQFQMPPGNQFPIYQNFPFMPLMSSGSAGRPAIPLGGAGGGTISKLPPNLPPINGMSKAEMDALYAQFMANGGPGPDRTALLANLMKMAANKPGFPPGLQLPPGLIAPSRPTAPKTQDNSEIQTSSAFLPTPSLDTMQPMTEAPLGNRVRYPGSASTSEEPPQIITMAEEPSIFEMVVKHKLGPSVQPSNSNSAAVMVSSAAPDSSTMQHIRPSKPVDSSKPTVNFQSNPQDVVVVQEIRNQHSHHQSSKESSNSKSSKTDIVYGKRIIKPTSSVAEQGTLVPSFTSPTSLTPSRTVHNLSPSPSLRQVPQPTTTAVGKPMVVPVDVDDGVQPKVGHGRGGVSTAPVMPTAALVDATRTLDATRNVVSKSAAHPSANKASSASQGSLHVTKNNSSSSKVNRDPSSAPSSAAKPYVRRPQFRPRPNVPIVRIDTCIVGDDSTCDTSLNEKCLTELGLSSCQCRPGFARIQPRTQCIPVLSLSLSFRIDKMNGNKVQFTRPLLNANTEEYQYLEYESIIALNSMFAATKTLATELMGVKVNRFYSIGGKTIVNATVNLRAESNETSSSSSVTPSTIKRTLQQELMQVISSTNNQLGDSQLWVDSTSNAITRIDDLNECSNADHNDCSKHARCYNEFGSFRCECEAGYEDKYADDKHRAGRYCASCSPSYCSNRGECLIMRGERVCKCRANFIGAQCDIDAEVLGVAIGGSIAALIIIVITFICLWMWNQRFKQEQQKIEAMSAASGHTFSYVNKHGPPTMSRMSIDERYGRSWATHYSDSQQHLLGTGGSTNTNNANSFYGAASDNHHQTGSGQPVYATPVRVIAQNGSSSAVNHSHDYEHQQQQQIPYPDYAPSVRSGGRSLKLKHQNATGTTRQANLNGHHGLHYPTYAMKLAPDSYNETEFSTRELIYSPAHLYATNPRSSHGFYS